jgi:hypothetical protein
MSMGLELEYLHEQAPLKEKVKMSGKKTKHSVSSLSAAARALSAKGASKGGHARASKLTSGQRKEIASMGGKAKASEGHK